MRYNRTLPSYCTHADACIQHMLDRAFKLAEKESTRAQ